MEVPWSTHGWLEWSSKAHKHKSSCDVLPGKIQAQDIKIANKITNKAVLDNTQEGKTATLIDITQEGTGNKKVKQQP